MSGSRGDLLARLLPYLAGHVTLAEFTAIALALGIVVPQGHHSPELFAQVLYEERGNVSAAARRLHVCTKTIYRRLRSQGVDLVIFRTESGPS